MQKKKTFDRIYSPLQVSRYLDWISYIYLQHIEYAFKVLDKNVLFLLHKITKRTESASLQSPQKALCKDPPACVSAERCLPC